MAVTDAVLGFIADIGIEAARKQYNIKQNEYQVDGLSCSTAKVQL